MSEIKKLKNKKSKGVDGVDNLTIKECSWYLVDVMTFLFNFSLESGVFPNVLKTAIVIPVHKKGDVLRLNNYRPISLLSTFSKILEKLIKRRLVNYLNKIQFLNDNQFGFTAGKSTEEALLHFLSHIHETLNNSLKPSALFIDISKAFDTVDHSILLKKLLCIGIRGRIFQWFTSYLQNRRQVVKINETFSCPGYVTSGVPQGSVLGPVLFLIYFNSIFDINLAGHATAFADDLALTYTSNGNFIETQSMLQRDLDILSKWFYHHRLILSDKSRAMLFGRANHVAISNNLKYHAYSCTSHPCTPDCFELIFVDEFKYLGLTLDMQLKWTSHINNVRKSVIMAVHKFYYLRPLCPNIVLRKLYHALVESIIMYGISSWGGIYFANIEDLYMAQKRIVKLIYNRPRMTPTVPLFQEIKLLPLRYLYVFKVLKIFFLRSNKYHSRTTYAYNMRNANNFVGLRCNSERYRRSYLYMAPYWFHMLPKSLKILTSERKKQFEREIRTWLFNIHDIEKYF